MKIAIVGAGNAGCAHAVKLKEYGHTINLLKTSNSMHDENFEHISKMGGINCIDNTNNKKEYFVKIDLITRDIIEALKDVDIVLIFTQTLQHKKVSELICPFINQKTKMVLVVPGNLGSVYFRNKLSKNILVGEGESTPYDARIIEPGTVNILFENVRNALSFIPANDSFLGIEYAKSIIPKYKYLRTNIIESALHNPNLIVHTIGTIMSANRIEYTNGDFWMYKEAFTDSIWNLVNALDKEKNSVLSAFDCKQSKYIDECKFRNEEDLTKDSLSVFQSYGKNGGPKGPSSIYTRYIFEDVPKGLCVLSSLANKSGIETPICNSLINIASALVNKDFWKENNLLEELKWNDMSLKEIKNFISGV